MNKIIGTERDWEEFGKKDPYYGVLTSDIFKKENMTTENKEIFFKTGENYVGNVMQNIKKYIDPSFIPERTLDFGCGVGRLLIPLAKHSKYVLGMDISQSMLNEAMANCNSFDIQNVQLVKADNRHISLSGKFNLIHSFIVFQHIPIKYGENTFKILLKHLDSRGIGVFHFTYSVPYSKNIIPLIKNKFSFTHNISNLLKGRPFFKPRMQMNNYDLNRILSIIQKHEIKKLYSEFTNHNGALGIIIYFRKTKSAK